MARALTQKTFKGMGSIAVGDDARPIFYVFTITRSATAIDGTGHLQGDVGLLQMSFGQPARLALSSGEAFGIVISRIVGDRAEFSVADGVPEELWS